MQACLIALTLLHSQASRQIEIMHRSRIGDELPSTRKHNSKYEPYRDGCIGRDRLECTTVMKKP